MRARISTGDDGLSLVEVLIAMFLLAILSLAVLPLIIGATQVSVVNRDLAEANAFANAQLAPVKDAFPVNPITPTSCAVLETYEAEDVADPAGTGMRAAVAVGPCAGPFPKAVDVTVTVSDSDGALVTLPTRILVSAS